MARDNMTGRDAASIKPKFVPDDELLPRDDSGGPDFTKYTAQFGDGGEVTGSKPHLSPSGAADAEADERYHSKRGKR